MTGHPCGTGERPIRVLRVIARLNVGGPARHVVLLNAGLDAAGFDTLLAHGAVGPCEASMEDLVDRFHVRTAKVPRLGRRVSILDDLAAFTALLRLVFRYRPDVVHTHTAKAGTLGRLCAWIYNTVHRRPKRALVVHTFHGHVLTGYFGRVGTAAARITERALSCVTHRVIVISGSQREDLVVRFGVASPSQVEVIPLGLDLVSFLTLEPSTESRREYGVAPDDFVVGYVGRLVPVKNVELLLKAFSLFATEVPGARLLVAGDGEQRAALEGTAHRLGITKLVSFLGWERNLERLYASIDVLALSSINEGTPVALIEAMAAAVPVVATRVGGVADVVEDGRTGLLVPSGDAQTFAGALGSLYRSPSFRAELGHRARETVRGRFSQERLVSSMLSLYRSELAALRRRDHTIG